MGGAVPTGLARCGSHRRWVGGPGDRPIRGVASPTVNRRALLALVVAVGLAVVIPPTASADDAVLSPPTELTAYRASDEAIVVAWTPSLPVEGPEVSGYEAVGGGGIGRSFGPDADFALVLVDDASAVAEVAVTAFAAGGVESPSASVAVRNPIVGVDVPDVDETRTATPITSALVADDAVHVGAWLSGDGRWIVTGWRSDLLTRVIALDLDTGEDRVVAETEATCCAPVLRVSDNGRVLLLSGGIVDLVTGETTSPGASGFDERTGETFEADGRTWIRTFGDAADPTLSVDLLTSQLLREGFVVPQGPPLDEVELQFGDRRLGVFAVDRPAALRLAAPIEPDLGVLVLLDEYDGDVMRRRIAATFDRPGFRSSARIDVGAVDGTLERAAFGHLGRHYVVDLFGDGFVRIEGVQRALHLSNDGSIALYRTATGAAYVDLAEAPDPSDPPGEDPPVDVPPEDPPVEQPAPLPVEPAPAPGYWMAERTGELYGFGTADGFGAAGSQVVSIATDAAGSGLWVLRADGVVETRGGAGHFGDVDLGVPGRGESVTTLAVRPGGDGYWVFTDRGRALPFGAADFFGDMSAVVLNGPVVASAATADGEGYWMVGDDGGIFSFGSAEFSGSTGDLELNEPVVGMATDPDGDGYWLVAADGGIFAFDTEFLGSLPGVLAPGVSLNAPVIGALAYGDGYLLVAGDGGIFNFSDQEFLGSLGGQALGSPIVGVAAFVR